MTITKHLLVGTVDLSASSVMAANFMLGVAANFMLGVAANFMLKVAANFELGFAANSV